MTEEQEFLSFYMFENGPGLANAIGNFSFLKGNLADQILDANVAGSWRHIDAILNSIGVYINVVDEEEADIILAGGTHGYYISEADVVLLLEMPGKRKTIFDAVCKAYSVNIEGLVWK